jgi:Bifunctional PLP-dependent enzyme with beta-cystathionase and maltose regulon repressor activities
MQYAFDQVIDRGDNYASKYDERTKKFGTQDVLPLWVADMDFKTAQPIIDALSNRAQQGIFGYTSRPDSYFEAVCDWQLRRNGWKIDRSLVSFSTGVVPALSAIVHQFSNPGDKILIQTPVYPEFEDSIRAWNRELLVNSLVEKDGVYTVDFEGFEQALHQRPKFFILCSPHNPVGRVWTREELLQMCQLCVKHGVRIVSDEIHSDLLLWGNKHIPTTTLSQEIAASTITCISGTKTFNLAGLQASTTVFPNAADKELFDKFWRNLDILRNNCFSLVAMEAAFRHGEEWLTQLLTYLEGNIRFIHDTCAQRIPRIKANIPESTYLIWLDCRGLGMSDAALAEFMVKKAQLGMNSGASFGKGGEGYMRLNAACPRSVLEQAMEQLAAAVNGLK